MRMTFSRTKFRASDFGAEYSPHMMCLFVPRHENGIEIDTDFHVFSHEMMHWWQHIGTSSGRFLSAIQCLRGSISHLLLHFRRQIVEACDSESVDNELARFLLQTSLIPPDDNFLQFAFVEPELIELFALIPEQTFLKMVWRDLFLCEQFFLHGKTSIPKNDLPNFLESSRVFSRCFAYIETFLVKRKDLLSDVSEIIYEGISDDRDPEDEYMLDESLSTVALMEAMSFSVEIYRLLEIGDLEAARARFHLRQTSTILEPFRLIAAALQCAASFKEFCNLIPIVCALCQEALNVGIPPFIQQDAATGIDNWYPPNRFRRLLANADEFYFPTLGDIGKLGPSEIPMTPRNIFDICMQIAMMLFDEDMTAVNQLTKPLLSSRKRELLQKQFSKFDPTRRIFDSVEKDGLGPFTGQLHGDDETISRFELYEYIRDSFVKNLGTNSFARLLNPDVKTELFLGYAPPNCLIREELGSRGYGWPELLHMQFNELNFLEYPIEDIIFDRSEIETFRYAPFQFGDSNWVQQLDERRERLKSLLKDFYQIDITNKIIR